MQVGAKCNLHSFGAESIGMGLSVQVAGTTVACTSAGIPLLSLSRAGKVGTWSACKAYARCGCAEVGDQGNTPRGVGVRPTRVRTLRERNEVTRCQMASRCTKMAMSILASPFASVLVINCMGSVIERGGSCRGTKGYSFTWEESDGIVSVTV